MSIADCIYIVMLISHHYGKNPTASSTLTKKSTFSKTQDSVIWTFLPYLGYCGRGTEECFFQNQDKNMGNFTKDSTFYPKRKLSNKPFPSIVAVGSRISIYSLLFLGFYFIWSLRVFRIQGQEVKNLTIYYKVFVIKISLLLRTTNLQTSKNKTQNQSNA